MLLHRGGWGRALNGDDEVADKLKVYIKKKTQTNFFKTYQSADFIFCLGVFIDSS